MPQEQMQDPTQVGTQEQVPNETGLTDDELAAALGYITTLGEQQYMAMQPQEEEVPEEGMEQAPEEAPEEPMEEEEPEEDITAKFDEFKGEIEKVIDEKIGALTKTIEEALKDDEEE